MSLTISVVEFLQPADDWQWSKVQSSHLFVQGKPCLQALELERLTWFAEPINDSKQSMTDCDWQHAQSWNCQAGLGVNWQLTHDSVEFCCGTNWDIPRKLRNCLSFQMQSSRVTAVGCWMTCCCQSGGHDLIHFSHPWTCAQIESECLENVNNNGKTELEQCSFQRRGILWSMSTNCALVWLAATWLSVCWLSFFLHLCDQTTWRHQTWIDLHEQMWFPNFWLPCLGPPSWLPQAKLVPKSKKGIFL